MYLQIPAKGVTTGQVYELPEGWNDPRWELVTDPTGVDVSLPDNVNPPPTEARPAPGAPARGPLAVTDSTSAEEHPVSMIPPVNETPAAPPDAQ